MICVPLNAKSIERKWKIEVEEEEKDELEYEGIEGKVDNEAH